MRHGVQAVVVEVEFLQRVLQPLESARLDDAHAQTGQVDGAHAQTDETGVLQRRHGRVVAHAQRCERRRAGGEVRQH